MSKWDYNRNPCLGGGGRLFGNKTETRNPTNERDLGLAYRAVARLRTRHVRALCEHSAYAHALGQMYGIAKGIVEQLQANPMRVTSTKQMAFLLKTLELTEAPPVNDPAPSLRTALPKEPPGGRRQNFGT